MNAQNYEQLHSIVFRTGAAGEPAYPGYKPEVRELPNGDGKVDSEKRYAHIASKYLRDFTSHGEKELCLALVDAHKLALRVASELAVPFNFLPHIQFSALRVLEYPAGATSNLHTDFDLFTLMIYRDQPDCFVAHDLRETVRGDVVSFEKGAGDRLLAARKLNAQLHVGELGELIGLGPATPHEVIASSRPQHSIVYFAIPDHGAVLPTGQTVGDWLTERMSRSRTISVSRFGPLHGTVRSLA